MKLNSSGTKLALSIRASFFPFDIHGLLKYFILWSRKLILKNAEDNQYKMEESSIV